MTHGDKLEAQIGVGAAVFADRVDQFEAQLGLFADQGLDPREICPELADIKRNLLLALYVGATGEGKERYKKLVRKQKRLLERLGTLLGEVVANNGQIVEADWIRLNQADYDSFCEKAAALGLEARKRIQDLSLEVQALGRAGHPQLGLTEARGRLSVLGVDAPTIESLLKFLSLTRH